MKIKLGISSGRSSSLSSVFPPSLIPKPGTHSLSEDGPGHRGQETARGSSSRAPGQQPMVCAKSPGWKDQSYWSQQGCKEAKLSSRKLWPLYLASYWWRTHFLYFHLNTKADCCFVPFFFFVSFFFLFFPPFLKTVVNTKIPNKTPDPLTW